MLEKPNGKPNPPKPKPNGKPNPPKPKPLPNHALAGSVTKAAVTPAEQIANIFLVRLI
jgi:hypothetical protein